MCKLKKILQWKIIASKIGITENTTGAPSNKNGTKKPENSDKEDNADDCSTTLIQDKN